jgi:uncharacterized delta-60 repeat protein
MKRTAIFLRGISRRTLRTSFALIAIAFALTFFVPRQASAADSNLDPFFDDDGKVITSLGDGGYDYASGVAIQNDGKIIVAGSGGEDFALARYNPNGSLDQTFGNGGKVTTDFGTIESITGVVLQADGKIIAVGVINYAYDTHDFALARYNPDGSLDTSFDFDGKVITDFTTHDFAYAVALQSDGKIVAGGYIHDSGDGDFALARYNTDGSLDSSFDFDGKVTTDFAGFYDLVWALAIQPDGKIVAGGSASRIGTSDFALARYNSDGSLDTSFSGDGKQTTPFSMPSSSSAYALLIQPNGRIVAVGSFDSNFALARYNPDGSLDGSFDFDGKVITDFFMTQESAGSAVLQADGKIVAFGGIYNQPGTFNLDIALARYNMDGSLDPAFDSDGKLTTDFGSLEDYMAAGRLQADGKIIVVGSTNKAGTNQDFALARYQANGSLDAGFDVDGLVTTDISSNASEANGVAIQADGKIVAVGSTYKGVGNYDFALVRYNGDGSLDNTFGNAGKVTTDFFGSEDYGVSLVIQADGKIVVSGYANNGSNIDFALARYNPDGSLDKAFNGGKVTTDFAGADDRGLQVSLQADGKIIVAGYARISNNTDFAVARYHSDGSLDSSFDTDGKQTTAVATGADIATAVAVQADGKIVLGGYTRNGGTLDFALVRYNTDGSLDTSFDSDGKQITDFESQDNLALALQLQADGKIIAIGRVDYQHNIDFALVRYNSDGSLDTSFDSDGKVSTDFFGYPGSYNFNDYAIDAIIQADGKIIAVGFVVVPQTDNSLLAGGTDFALARYNLDGSLDTSFDADGKLTTDFLYQHPDYGHAVAAQADGKIVVAGRTDAGGSRKFGLARYGTGNNTPPNLTAVPISQARNTTATQTIAQVSDAEDMNTGLSVKVNGATSATINGVSLSNLTIDATGAVKAVVQTGCLSTNAAFTLAVTDTGLLPDSEALTVTITPDTQPPAITCPANLIAVTSPICSSPGSTTLGYTLPAFTDNCPGASVVCVPPPNASFPLGATTINCRVTDAAGNTAGCSFTVTVFDVCVQDDANPNHLLLWNSQTGDYRFCGNGVTYSGKGTVTIKGCTIILDHTTSGRKVKGQTDKSVYRAGGSFQLLPGQSYLLSDRDIRNNLCRCQ